MNDRKYDFIIAGSGAGGATLAKELSSSGKDVLVIEKGKQEREIGTVRDALRFFDGNRLTKIPRKSKEGVIVWRTIMAGGSTVVSCGNGTPCSQESLSEFGIELTDEFSEAQQEMSISPIAEELLSEGSERIMEASKELGYKMELMPKFINPAKCRKCGRCVFGCEAGAKWTALDYLQKAQENGVDVVYNTSVQSVLSENGKVRGLSAVGPEGPVEFLSDTVILAAGGLETPIILQRSGFEDAGQGLFIDLLVNTYGTIPEINQLHEPTMALVDREFHEDKGFILSPFIQESSMIRFIEAGVKASTMSKRSLMGIMTKTSDDPTGCVYQDGSISKPVTEDDWSRLNEGAGISKEILTKAGADSSKMVVSKPQGAHPGGTAAIGKIVDENLQTRMGNLFVCDASVLPESPGMPPIVTIVALAKRLAKTLQ